MMHLVETNLRKDMWENECLVVILITFLERLSDVCAIQLAVLYVNKLIKHNSVQTCTIWLLHHSSHTSCSLSLEENLRVCHWQQLVLINFLFKNYVHMYGKLDIVICNCFLCIGWISLSTYFFLGEAYFIIPPSSICKTHKIKEKERLSVILTLCHCGLYWDGLQITGGKALQKQILHEKKLKKEQ